MDLAYCSIPSRLIGREEEMMDFIQEGGRAPLNPMIAFPVRRYEAGPVGRKRTLEFCVRAIGICDTFHLFGISEGTVVYELKRAIILRKPIFLHVKEFDPDWKNALADLEESHMKRNKMVYHFLEKNLSN